MTLKSRLKKIESQIEPVPEAETGNAIEALEPITQAIQKILDSSSETDADAFWIDVQNVAAWELSYQADKNFSTPKYSQQSARHFEAIRETLNLDEPGLFAVIGQYIRWCRMTQLLSTMSQEHIDILLDDYKKEYFDRTKLRFWAESLIHPDGQKDDRHWLPLNLSPEIAGQLLRKDIDSSYLNCEDCAFPVPIIKLSTIPFIDQKSRLLFDVCPNCGGAIEWRGYQIKHGHVGYKGLKVNRVA